MSNFDSIKSRDDSCVLHTYSRFPVAIERGQNATCWGFDGKSYIDFTSGIGVNSLGFCDPQWAQAVADQALTLQHISNLYYTEPCVKVAEALTAATGLSKVFFANSGAESNEGAIKAARKYSFLKYGAGRDHILCLNNSFHGRTVTTLAATGQEVFHNYFFPFTEGFLFAQANDMADVRGKADNQVCAVMVELIQGEGGVLPLEQDFVAELAAFCRERDILLIVDEVQTGVGRTGSLYAFQQFGIMPDIVTSAKGLAGGLPFAAVLFGEKAAGALGPGDHATTFGGNPIAAAASCEVLRRLTPAFLDEVQAKGQQMRERILTMHHVAGIAGMGLMLGVELKDGVKAVDVVNAGFSQGVLLLTAKHKLRLLPPLTISQPELSAGLAALEATLAQM